MIFRSRFTGYQVLVRPAQEKWHPTMNVMLGETPRITADFGHHGGEYTYVGPDGNEHTAADIRGGYFDSVAAQQTHGWTDEEREIVEQTVLKICEQRPDECWVHSTPKAVKPWPTYDDVHHNQVPVLAEQLGLVGEALAYERENKNRPGVVEKLSELAERDNAAEELTAA